jgi:hypothetical protein
MRSGLSTAEGYWSEAAALDLAHPFGHLLAHLELVALNAEIRCGYSVLEIAFLEQRFRHGGEIRIATSISWNAVLECVANIVLCVLVAPLIIAIENTG